MRGSGSSSVSSPAGRGFYHRVRGPLALRHVSKPFTPCPFQRGEGAKMGFSGGAGRWCKRIPLYVTLHAEARPGP